MLNRLVLSNRSTATRRGAALGLALAITALSPATPAAEVSITEVQYQRGTLDVPTFAGGGSAATDILTLQNYSLWRYGESFFFVDYLRDDKVDGFNDDDWYGEWYPTLSLARIRGEDLALGPVRDIGLIAGLNLGADANVVKFLPGVRLAWTVPGFAFFNTDFFAYVEAGDGIAGGGAPKEEDAFFVDINFAYPFAVGGQRFSVEGHVEYLGPRDTETGQRLDYWVLGQPQLRWDLGHAVFGEGAKDQLFVGIEYQFWINKLGDSDTDESAVQALLVWRL
ncbi:nucleoside-binding protein [Algiphilus sp.]|uniref:nucleoside-binding protein n=1 Tax=Algiphilus sp. TaxID=1872431 RepID=UPI0032EE3E1D